MFQKKFRLDKIRHTPAATQRGIPTETALQVVVNGVFVGHYEGIMAKHKTKILTFLFHVENIFQSSKPPIFKQFWWVTVLLCLSVQCSLALNARIYSDAKVKYI